MEQTAEQIASTNLARLILADNRQPSRSVRCLKPERSMRTMPVVVLDIDPQDLLQVGSSYDQEPVQELGADGADPTGRIHCPVVHRQSELELRRVAITMARSGGKAFFNNFGTYDAPFPTRARLALANSWRKVRTRSGCCGNYGQPGC